MQVTGMPSGGKRVSLGGEGSIHLPYGAVYEKDGDGNVSISMLSPIPGNYRDGSFTIDDDNRPLWRLYCFSSRVSVDPEGDAKSVDIGGLAEFVQAISDALAKKTDAAVADDDKRKDTYKVTDDEVILRSSLSLGHLGGKSGKVAISGNVAYCLSEMKVRIGMEGEISYYNAIAGTLKHPGGKIFYGLLQVSDPDRRDKIFEESVVRVLKTLEPDGPGEDTAQTYATASGAAAPNSQSARSFTSLSDGIRYTYTNFANDVIALTDGGRPDAELLRRMKEKAADLLATQNTGSSKPSVQSLSGLSFTVVGSGSRYTYLDFANDAIAMINGASPDTETIRRIVDKANALISTQNAKEAYSTPAAAVSGSASQDSEERAARIMTVLGYTPMTAADINAAMGTTYTTLQIANAMKLREQKVSSEKVVRTTMNAAGLRVEREYTAWSLK